MKLCIAEKPSVAKDIAKVIGATAKMNGYFEGNGYWVSWTFGHLCGLKEPQEYTDQWKYWNLDSLPMIPSKFGIKVINQGSTQKQFSILEDLITRCDEVINCGDAGQEGELIQRWVLAKAKSTKPLKRLWISSLTEEAIKEGFQKLQEGSKYDNLYAAGSSRAIGDWLLGMNATRLYTIKFGQKGQVFSIGRVQTPTLAILVNRQLEIDAFSASKFWEIRTLYRDVYFACTLGKIETEQKGSEFLASITNADLEIVNYEQKEGKELPPSLFDLTSIQVECNKRFGFSAEETLNKVQKLYEQKLVTYPRVDTTYLSDDIYPKVPEILSKLSFYSRFTASLLTAPIKKSKKVFDNTKVTDHHAIIPTGETPSGITPDENKVYDAITRRFIAVFYPDCKVSNTVVEAEVNAIGFRASGRQVLENGWREVYLDYGTSKAKEEGEEEQLMPIFEKGEKGPHEPELQEKTTKPPKYYNEGSLLRAMETAGKSIDDDDLRELMKDNGIGRPSTRANIIETLAKRGYIKKEKKRIMATPLGVHLISLIQNDLLKSPELTGQWEKKLRDIERGTYEVETFKKELIDMVALLCHEVKHQFAKPQPMICPKCNSGELLTGKAAWGCSRYKDGCKYTIPFDYEGIRLSEGDLRSLLTYKRSKYRFPFKDKKGNESKNYIQLTDKLKLEIQKE